MFILDTDTLSLIWRGQEKVAEKLRLLGGLMKVPLAISHVTYIEVLRGRFANIFAAADGAELGEALRRYDETADRLQHLQIIPFDEAAISYFDKLRSVKKLNKMGRPDLLIACIVLAQSSILVTRNTKDFTNVPNLKVENWAD